MFLQQQSDASSGGGSTLPQYVHLSLSLSLALLVHGVVLEAVRESKWNVGGPVVRCRDGISSDEAIPMGAGCHCSGERKGEEEEWLLLHELE